MLHQNIFQKFLQNYKMLYESSDEAYHYASLYSNSGTVLHYLVRLPPFTKMFLDYQGNNKSFKNTKDTIDAINCCENKYSYRNKLILVKISKLLSSITSVGGYRPEPRSRPDLGRDRYPSALSFFLI